MTALFYSIVNSVMILSYIIYNTDFSTALKPSPFNKLVFTKELSALQNYI